MFYGAIQKIKVTRFIMDHGVELKQLQKSTNVVWKPRNICWRSDFVTQFQISIEKI